LNGGNDGHFLMNAPVSGGAGDAVSHGDLAEALLRTPRCGGPSSFP